MNLEEIGKESSSRNVIDDLKTIEKNTNKEYLLDQFNYANRTAESLLKKHPELSILASFMQEKKDAEAVNYSRPDLEDELRPENLVNIANLMNSMDKIQSGKVFLGRVIIKPRQWNESTFFLAEDWEGERAVKVAIDNNPLPSFSTNAVVAIFNPCLQNTSDGGVELRPGTGSKDVLLLTEDVLISKFPKLKWHNEADEDELDDPENSDIPRDLDLKGLNLKDKIKRLKYEGNKMFVGGNYVAAIQIYSKGLALSADDEDLLANRALCYLKIETYQSALKDALNCLIKNPPHLKAIYRAAQAYVGLRQPEKAKTLIDSKLKLDIPKKDLKKLLVRVDELLAQKKYGRYDMIPLFKSMETFIAHDVSDYVGAVVVRNIPGKGRGLIATRDIKAGELILSSQAFAIHVSEQGDYYKSVSELLKIIIKKIKKVPTLRKELYKLSAGMELGYLDTSKDDWTKIDTERIRGIIKVNCFRKKLKGGSESFGLWIMPSYINNDCHYSNCSNVLFGNVRQIRSMRPLKKGEEILIAYRTHAEPLRQLLFSDPQFGIACECEYCKFEVAEPADIRSKRHSAITSFVNRKFTEPLELEDVIMKIQEASSQSPFIDHYLAWPYFKLGNLYFARKNIEKARDIYTQFLTSWPRCGGDVTLWLCAASERVFQCNMNLNDMKSANISKDKYFEYVKLRYGRCDNEFLEIINPGITKSIDEVNASLKPKV